MALKIGFIENYIGKDKIVFWFYRDVNGTWKRIATQKIHRKNRQATLNRILLKSSLVPLGLGT